MLESESKPGVKRGRPDEIKLPVGLRMFHTDRTRIEAKYGKIQKFFDHAVEKELAEIESEGIEAKSSDEITANPQD